MSEESSKPTIGGDGSGASTSIHIMLLFLLPCLLSVQERFGEFLKR